MFENFFQKQSEETRLAWMVSDELNKMGINGMSINKAFRALREENEKKKLGLTNNHLLNIVKHCALTGITSMDEALVGMTREQIEENIKKEIQDLRLSLPEEEQKS